MPSSPGIQPGMNVHMHAYACMHAWAYVGGVGGALPPGERKATWCVLTTRVMQRLVVDGSPGLDRPPAGLAFLTQCCEGLARLLEAYLLAGVWWHGSIFFKLW